MVPSGGGLRARAAAAICESRLGGGGRYFRYTPGNLAFVDDYPDDSIVADRAALLDARADRLDDLPSAIRDAGRKVVYTPETVLSHAPRPLFRPRLAEALDYGRIRGTHTRARPTALRLTTLLPVGLVLFLLLLAPVELLLAGGLGRVWLAGIVLYGAVLLLFGVASALRSGSLLVGAIAMPGLVGTHVAFGIGFAAGLAWPRR
jgi:hypothetical protein